MKKLIIGSSVLAGLLPAFAFAATLSTTCTTAGGTTAAGLEGNSSTLFSIVCKLAEFLNTLLPLMLVIGILYFVWGVITYMISADEEQKTKGRDKMIYGIIGLAVITGVWGLVNILTRTFGVQGSQPIVVPCILGTPGCSTN
jgi:hypothetical protein